MPANFAIVTQLYLGRLMALYAVLRSGKPAIAHCLQDLISIALYAAALQGLPLCAVLAPIAAASHGNKKTIPFKYPNPRHAETKVWQRSCQCTAPSP